MSKFLLSLRKEWEENVFLKITDEFMFALSVSKTTVKE